MSGNGQTAAQANGRLRLVCLGDSFTEGVGDELPDGTVRGWADMVAVCMANVRDAPVEYANLAIRGRLMAAIVAEQLEPALALEPTVLTFNGGGNDMLRPRADVARICALTEHVISRCREEGVQPVILSGGNPTRHLPLGSRIKRLGDRLTAAVTELTAASGVPFADNWTDAELARLVYWNDDRLHLNAAGHRRVAARVVDTLGFACPTEWMVPVPHVAPHPGWKGNLDFYRRHVAPWLRRRLTGRSSGDNRQPKYARWVTIEPGSSLPALPD